MVFKVIVVIPNYQQTSCPFVSIYRGKESKQSNNRKFPGGPVTVVRKKKKILLIDKIKWYRKSYKTTTTTKTSSPRPPPKKKKKQQWTSDWSESKFQNFLRVFKISLGPWQLSKYYPKNGDCSCLHRPFRAWQNGLQAHYEEMLYVFTSMISIHACLWGDWEGDEMP